MTELSFSRDLYAESALDDAVATYARFAQIELVKEDARFVVRVSGPSAAREARVLLELSNHALGRSVEQRAVT